MNCYQEFLNRGDCILLLVDIQKSMLDLCADRDRIVLNAGALIETAGVFGIPVLCSAHNPAKLGGFLPELIDKISGPKVFSEPKVISGPKVISEPKVLDKLEFNCFENEGIGRAILETGRKTLLLAGLEGHVCIFHTGAGALRNGYRVHIAHDAVTSRSASDKQTGMHRLDRAGAVISSTEMIIFELLNRAGTKEFRALLPLLKRLQSS